MFLSFAAAANAPGAEEDRDAARRSFTVMTWNIHHGEGMDGRLDLERIAALIREARPDLVALQEVDQGVDRTEGRDLPAELGELTAMTPVFARNIDFQGGRYGNATLSRWPVLSSTNHHYRMVRDGEQRGLLKTRINLRGRTLEFWNTHIDFRPDDTERLSNVAEIRAHLARGNFPVILAGDFNDRPDSRTYQGMSEAFTDTWAAAGEGDGSTFPGRGNARRIDYLWISRGSPIEVRRVRVVPSEASDHWPVIAELEWKDAADPASK